VKRLIKKAPKFNKQEVKRDTAEDKKILDDLNSSLLYCGLLLKEKQEHVVYAFVLQAIYSFGVSANFFEKLTFESMESDETVLNLINESRVSKKMKCLTDDEFKKLHLCYSNLLILAIFIKREGILGAGESNQVIVNMKSDNIGKALGRGFYMVCNFKGARQVTNADKILLSDGSLQPLKLLKYNSAKEMKLLNVKCSNLMKAYANRHPGAVLYHLLKEKCTTCAISATLKMHNLDGSDDSEEDCIDADRSISISDDN